MLDALCEWAAERPWTIAVFLAGYIIAMCVFLEGPM